MHIKKIILHNFKRFFLTNIKTLTLEPKNKISIILAGNGTGKSQLLSQLTPLPANLNKDFKDGGYKYIEIIHNNNTYKLTSGVDGTKKHSFIVNDVELNQGGTITVQNSLVKEHFNITPQIHQVLLGNSLFTNMSPNERKKWITEISNVDYSYSISVYNKLKQRHRDIVGGIKLIQENIVKQESTLLKDDEADKLNTDKKYLKSVIEHLTTLLSITTSKYDLETIENNVNITINKYNNIVNNIDTSVNIETLKTDKAVLLSKINNNKAAIKDINKELDKLEHISEHNVTLKEVNDSIDKLTGDINKHSTNINIPYTKDNIPHIVKSYKNTYNDTIDLLGNIKALDEVDTKQLEVLKNKLEDTNLKIHRLESKIAVATEEVNHMKTKHSEDNKIVCENCNHTWYNGYDVNFIKKRNNDIEMLSKELDKYLKLKDKLIADIEVIETKLSYITTLRNMVSSNTYLKDIFKQIVDGLNIQYKGCTELYNRYSNVRLDIVRLEQLDSLNKQLEELNKVKKEVEYKEAVIKETKTSSKDKLLDKLNKLTKANNDMLDDVKRIDNNINLLTDANTYIDKLKKYIRYWYSNYDVSKINTRNKYLNDLISKLKYIYNDIDIKLNKHNNIKDKIDNDNLLLKDYIKKEKVLKLMLKELSPTEGLIAKSINSFLNLFLKDINKLINSVWNYGIELLPSEISNSSDLDYKFRVKVDNREIIDDISKTSSSMQEIINLSFRVMFIKYMRFEEYPLILDEFGKTFDPEHRIAAYNIIDKIISSKFNQIFMVNHYESLYSRFTNADICVLSTNGVDLNNLDSYNKTLNIVRS